MMSFLKKSWLSVLGAVSVGAAPVRVGVLSSSDNKHIDDFDPQLSAISAKVDHAKDDMEATKRMMGNLKNYDVVMVPPLHGFTNPRIKCHHETPEKYIGELKKWIENGGFLYISDANYTETLKWVAAIDPSLAVESGPCGQSGGPAKKVEPVDPLLVAPHPIDPAWTWGHMNLPDEKSTGWRVAGVCNHDHPTIMTKRLGKGLIYIASVRGGEDKIIQNFFAQRTLSEVGLEVVRTKVPDLVSGMNTVKAVVRGIGEKDVETRMTFSVNEERFVTNLVVKAGSEQEIEMDCGVRSRGKILAEIKIGSGKAEAVCYGREFYLPEFFDIKGTSYRGGIIVPERRFDTVSVVTTLYPFDEDPQDYVVRMKAYEGDSCAGKQLSEAVKSVHTGIDTVKMPLSKDLPAGSYWVRGELVRVEDQSVVYEKEFALTVLAQEPGTIVADDDGTFLLEGEPFFPLGVYHSDSDARSYERVGCNLFHTMKWGAPRDYNNWKTHENGMFIFWEEKPGDDAHLDGLTKFWRDTPSLFSYYLADEPPERAYEGVLRNYNRFVERDNRRPTFVCACYPETWKRFAWACDIMGSNPYPYWPNFKRDTVRCNWIPLCEASGRTRPTLAVPQAFGHEEEAPLRCMSLTAVANGVNGICWYAWQNDPSEKSGARFHEASITNLTDLVADIKTIAPALMNPVERKSIHQKKLENGAYLNWCFATMPETGTRILVVTSQSAEPVVERLVGAAKGIKANTVRAVGKAYGEFKIEGDDIVLSFGKFGSGIWSFGGEAPKRAKRPCDFAVGNLPARASGKVRTVNAADGEGALQAALDKAKHGDVIEVGEGEYGPIECANKLVDIVAVGRREKTILRGAEGRRAATLSVRDVGNMSAETNVLVRGFTIVGGADTATGAPAIKRGGCVFGGTLENCVVEKGSAVYGGGMAYGRAVGCTFRNNRASFNGGAGIFLAPENCEFVRNEAGFDGGALEYSRVTLCVFTENKAGRNGGALNFGEAKSSKFFRNTCGKNGGAGKCASFRNCLMVGNEAGQDGGAVMGGNVTFCTVVKNVAKGIGGAVCGSDSYGTNVMPAPIRGSIVWDNVSKGDKNATRSFADTTDVEHSVVEPMAGVEYKGNVITTKPAFGKAYHLRDDSVGVDVKHGIHFNKEEGKELDPDGQARFSGKYADFGCYEVALPEEVEEKKEGK